MRDDSSLALTGPIAASDRIHRLDVLRGFAVTGVYLVSLFEADTITPGGDEQMMAAGSFFENAQGSIDMMGLVGRFATGAATTNQPPAPKPQGPVRAPDPGGGP